MVSAFHIGEIVDVLGILKFETKTQNTNKYNNNDFAWATNNLYINGKCNNLGQSRWAAFVRSVIDSYVCKYHALWINHLSQISLLYFTLAVGMHRFVDQNAFDYRIYK